MSYYADDKSWIKLVTLYLYQAKEFIAKRPNDNLMIRLRMDGRWEVIQYD
tara:strand:+ start:553 stop:702 length:150 start_codon:yes stop_codon:yes gene_type:complete